MNPEVRERALAEIALCERILAKDGLSVLSEALRDVSEIDSWTHYPPGDVFDRSSGAQWFYHCHPPVDGAGEHGHFHCFLRPGGEDGPIHHLIAVGVDAYGRLRRLFTVNRWVVEEDWLDAEQVVKLLPRFNVELARPSYLVNRWLTAVITAYEEDIAGLIRERDRILRGHTTSDGVSALEDRALEVISEFNLAES
ncbi:MAG: hypothetical protein H6883_11410 [Rhodobiaceae bacterium]|nr:hypothetical protein [Rhodobiaceae bacterium]